MKDMIIRLGRNRTVALFAVACVLVSVLITYLVMAWFADGINTIGLVISILVPALIAPTATWHSTGLILKIHDLEQEARKLATYDSLTTVMTRRAFMDSALSVMKVASRNHAPFSLLYLDVDDFKQVNDTHGHPAGDEVLRQFGEIIRHQIRASDLVGRIGGEEFALALADTHLGGAMHLAEKLRRSLGQHVVQYKQQAIQCTASIGISATEWNQPLSFEQLCNQADKALYRAKKSGKNRVTHSVNPGPAAAAPVSGPTEISGSVLPPTTPRW
ncbi:diguanylate cyclase [Porticoccus sp. W117]|uniref:GGDEF domain-containing protein n=1 Tax=Porticoccus sp. W117 TaxID=3054777 RepID=UPI002597C0E1|nr:diguanylate cyclase [Porticoccus sp. W117]MDM3871464.1 diguanylate cyclase [Porticoccus sp. W117]